MAYYITLDAETTGGFGAPEVYDLGVVVADADTQEIVETLDFVIEEIFYNDSKMRTAYYADKIPAYCGEIKNGTRTVVPFRVARGAVLALMKQYNVRELWAYNASFDSRALEHTSKELLGLPFFPRTFKAEWKCSLRLFRDTIGATEEYKEKADRTPTGRVSCKAESAYKFIADDPDFVEAHTGRRDAEIETQILFACLAMLLDL